MISKKAKQTLVFCIAQSLVIFGTAVFFQGDYFKKILPIGVAILFSGVTMFFVLLAQDHML